MPDISCPSGKQCYPTADAAWKLLRLKKSKAWLNTHKRRGVSGSVYRCTLCNTWHISSEKKPRDHQPRHTHTQHLQQEAL